MTDRTLTLPDGRTLGYARYGDPDGTPVVYHHGGHFVSLTTLRGTPAVSGGSIAGYNVKVWRQGEFTYVAVADLSEGDLEAFKAAFLAGLSQ